MQRLHCLRHCQTKPPIRLMSHFFVKQHLLQWVLAAMWLTSMPNAVAGQQAAPITLTVDATDVARRLLHADLSIPVRPGPLKLLYPRWPIPSYQLPMATLNNIVGLRIATNGRTLNWRRDPADLFSFLVEVPPDAPTLTVSMDVVVPVERSDLNAATPNVLVLDWNTVVLYPVGADAAGIRPRLRLPEGWSHASALGDSGLKNGSVQFSQTSLTTLIDSPVLAGRYLEFVEISPRYGPRVFIHVAAESPGATRLSDRWQSWIRRMVAEAGIVYDGYPFPSYHFLLALSDGWGNDGLEHRRSCDIRMSLDGLQGESNRLAYGYLIPHEFTHAWNGKFRIPAGMNTLDLQRTQTTELLWVYEGLTRYLNWVLAARSGLFTPAEARDYLAFVAAQMDHRPGREWRSLQDTAIAGQILNDAPTQWQSVRRGVDYYDEALLIWLEADVMIRRGSKRSRSLDDFCRLFLRPASPNAGPEPYTFNNLISLLNRVQPLNWQGFFSTRLDATGRVEATFDGVNLSGWNVVYTSVANVIQKARAAVDGVVDDRFNTGLLVDRSGGVLDVVRDSPAWKAGMGPYMKVVAVDGKAWDASLDQIVFASPVVLRVQNGSVTFQASIAGRKNGANPHLVANSNADVLSNILKARTPEER